MILVVDKPGYFGKKRSKKVEFYNNLFGEESWSECWNIDGKLHSFEEAVVYHDEAYHAYLKTNPEVLNYVIQFGDCYDSDPCQVQCGCQHDAKAPVRHLEDISIRRALVKLGVWFQGPDDYLLPIRGQGSGLLDPAYVPFHRPELIIPEPTGGPIPKWANPKSVAAFWQSTKVIAVEQSLSWNFNSIGAFCR